MLIMSRKPGDAITIGGNVIVRVMAIEGGRVQLGIDAPKEVKVAAVPPPAGPDTRGK